MSTHTYTPPHCPQERKPQRSATNLISKKPSKSGIKKGICFTDTIVALALCCRHAFLDFQTIMEFAREVQFLQIPNKFSLASKTRFEWQVSCNRYTLHHLTMFWSPKKGRGKENKRTAASPTSLPLPGAIHPTTHTPHIQHHSLFNLLVVRTHSQKVYIPGNVLVFQSWTTPSDSLTV